MTASAVRGSSTGAVALALGVAIALLAGCTNFHKVTPELYRSAQPTAEQVAQWAIEAPFIRSIVDLRGLHPDWAEQIAVRGTCLILGVEWYNVRMSARRAPTPGEVAQLREIFRVAPRPILIHCKAGADRTGLAVAIHLIGWEGLSAKEAADRALSLRYGHLSLTHPHIRKFILEEFKP